MKLGQPSNLRSWMMFNINLKTGSCSIWRLLFTTSKLGSQCFQCFPAAFQDSVVIFNTLHVGPLSSQTSNWFIEFIQMNMMIGWWSDSGTQFSMFFLLVTWIFKLLKLPKTGWLQDPTFGISQNGSPTVKVGSTDAIKGLLVWNACGRDRGKTFADDVFAFSCGYSNMGCGCGRVLVYMELGYIWSTYRYGSISIHVWMYAYRYSTYGTYHHGINVYNVYHRLSFVCTVSTYVF